MMITEWNKTPYSDIVKTTLNQRYDEEITFQGYKNQ